MKTKPNYIMLFTILASTSTCVSAVLLFSAPPKIHFHQVHRAQEAVHHVQEEVYEEEPQLIRVTEHWNNRALDGIRHFEGFKRKAYYCPAGVRTIGYGCTKHKVVNLGTITHAQAMAVLQQEYDAAAANVDRIVKVPLLPYQRAALISFTLNCGQGNLSRLVNGKGRLNSGNYESVNEILPQYRKGGGKVLRGLEIRRNWELSIWNGDSSDQPELASN